MDEVDLRALGALVPTVRGGMGAVPEVPWLATERLLAPVGSRPADLDAALAEVERLRTEYHDQAMRLADAENEVSALLRRCADLESEAARAWASRARLQADFDDLRRLGVRLPTESEPVQRPDANAPAAALVRPVPAQPASAGAIPATALRHSR